MITPLGRQKPHPACCSQHGLSSRASQHCCGPLAICRCAQRCALGVDVPLWVSLLFLISDPIVPMSRAPVVSTRGELGISTALFKVLPYCAGSGYRALRSRAGTRILCTSAWNFSWAWSRLEIKNTSIKTGLSRNAMPIIQTRGGRVKTGLRCSDKTSAVTSSNVPCRSFVHHSTPRVSPQVRDVQFSSKE